MGSFFVFWGWQTQFGGNSYRNCRSGESQAKQHEEWNCLLCGFNVWHAKTPVIAAESRVHRFEDICEFQEIQANHRWCQYRQLRMKDIGDQFILIHRSYTESVHLEIRNMYFSLSPLLSALRIKIIHTYYCFCLQNKAPIHPPLSPACSEPMSCLPFALGSPPKCCSIFTLTLPTPSIHFLPSIPSILKMF